LDALRDALRALISSALLGFDGMVASAQDVLSQGLTIWLDVVTLSNVFRPFCYVIIGFCLMIELAQTAAKVDIVKWEYALRIGVKMVLARVCIDVAPAFLDAIYTQSAEWINSAAVAAIGGGVNLGFMIDGNILVLINGVTGIFGILGLFGSTLIVVLAIQVAGLLVMAIAFGRMFELYIYLAISPLPCAFFPLGNGDGSGFSRITARFFKNFAAVCLQGLMMIICMRLFGVLMINVITEGIAAALTQAGTVAVANLLYTMLLGSIVLVMAVFKCGSWAKAILDAA